MLCAVEKMSVFWRWFAIPVILVGILAPGGSSADFDPVIAQELQDKLDLVNQTLNTLVYKECIGAGGFIDLMVGAQPPYGEIDTSSVLSRFNQAYHTGIPSASGWNEFWLKAVRDRENMIEIRETQGMWKDLNGYHPNCSKALDDAKNAVMNGTDFGEDLNATIDECLENKAVRFLEEQPAEFEKRVCRACYESLTMVVYAFYYSAWPITFEYLFGWDWSWFKIMYDETLQFNLEVKDRINTGFPAYIQKEIAEGRVAEARELQIKLDEIKDRLTNTSVWYYRYIYHDGDEAKMSGFWLNGAKGYNNFKVMMEDFVDDNSTWQYFIHYYDWNYDIAIFLSEHADGTFSNLFNYIYDNIYMPFLEVKPLPTIKKDYVDTVGAIQFDGLWAWQRTTKPLHNMRVAWDLMGAMLEELKCYMKETYYFHLRPEALRRTQRNLTKGALFSGFSRTIHAPCRIVDDLDLTGPYCDRENNEICGPITPLEGTHRTTSEHHGGRTLLKPRWVYKYDDSKKVCVGRRDYVMNMYTCRCGFRMDCGADLGVNITCHLRYNDLLRGQCRGDVGYPCKTLPLAPGKHDQTCKSGYCNMQKNSCEDAPYSYHRVSSKAAPTLKGKLAIQVMVTVVCMGGLEVARNALFVY